MFSKKTYVEQKARNGFKVTKLDGVGSVDSTPFSD